MSSTETLTELRTAFVKAMTDDELRTAHNDAVDASMAHPENDDLFEVCCITDCEMEHRGLAFN